LKYRPPLSPGPWSVFALPSTMTVPSAFASLRTGDLASHAIMLTSSSVTQEQDGADVAPSQPGEAGVAGGAKRWRGGTRSARRMRTANCQLRQWQRGVQDSRRKDAIGGGLRESPALGRAMACRGDGILATPHGGRCLGYRPGRRYSKHRPPLECLVAVRSSVWPRSRESPLPLHLPHQPWTLTGPCR